MLRILTKWVEYELDSVYCGISIALRMGPPWRVSRSAFFLGLTSFERHTLVLWYEYSYRSYVTYFPYRELILTNSARAGADLRKEHCQV